MIKILSKVLGPICRFFIRKPRLIKIKVRLPNYFVLNLQFRKNARVALIRQSIGLQLAMDPIGILLFFNGNPLADTDSLNALNLVEGDLVEARFGGQSAQTDQENSFCWNGLTHNPFIGETVSNNDAERARQLFEKNERDSEKRLMKLQKLADTSLLPNNQLIAMTVNDGFLPLFFNWADSVRRHNIDVFGQTLVFPMDETSAVQVEQQGFRVYYDDESEILKSTGTSTRFGDTEFTSHMFFQNAVIQDLLESGFDLLFQDVDMVWHKNPLALLRSDTRSHLQFMFDGLTMRHAPLCANTGFMYFRNQPVTRCFWDIVYKNASQMFSHQSQQQPVNKILGSVQGLGLNVKILAERDFANGHLFAIEADKNRLPDDPYVIHCSWVYDIQQKYRKLMNNGLWYLDDQLET